ncbi:hypothetical protein QBC44DRAFT_334743 [Cladorrhinum sp. PSN332]|nr:hypothetical protein QBC44DRAFT_334743 [Cladorrhinum sp. PSN332]
MRGGLWQKQKRPSACLLCLYSYSSYSARRGLRALSNPATRPTIVRDGSILLASTAGTRQFGGKGFLPQWGTKQTTEVIADDDLLPHELAAREAARAAKAAKDAAMAKAKAEREEAARIAEAHRAAKAAEAAKAVETAPAPPPRAAAPLRSEPFSKTPPPLPYEPFSKAQPRAFVRPPAQRQAFTGNSPLKRSNAPLPPSEPVLRHIPLGSRPPLPTQPIRPAQPSPAPPSPPGPAPPPAPEPSKSELSERLESTIKSNPAPQVVRPIKPIGTQPPKGFVNTSIPAWGSFGKPIFGSSAAEPDDSLLPHERAALEQRRKAREEVEARERAEIEKAEQAKLAAERAALEQRRKAQEEAEARERAEIEKAQQAKLAAERADLEQRLKEIQEAEARLRVEQEKVEKARLALEQATRESRRAEEENVPRERQRFEQEKPKTASTSADPWAHLLPHERAAKEQAAKDQAAKDQAAKDQAARELQRAEDDRATAERQRVEQEKARAAAAAAPSADPWAHLLPHERAAKEQAAKERQRAEEERAAEERQRVEAEKAKAAAVNADPWAHLLPHERAAKEQAKKEREQRERAEREREEKARLAATNVDPLAHLVPHERGAHEHRMKERQGAQTRRASFYNEEAAPIRHTRSTRGVFRNPEKVDSREWQQLQRKDIPYQPLPTNPFKITSDPFRTALDPIRGVINDRPRQSQKDPWARLAQAKEPPKPLSTEADDAIWNNMIQPEEPPKSQPEPGKSWDWVNEHVVESQQKKVAAATAAAEEPKPYILPSDADVSAYDEHQRRGDRRARFDAPEKEKPKKPQPKQSGYGRDDEFDEYEYEERRRRKAERKADKEIERLAAAEGPTPILLPEFISVANLAVALRQKVKPFVQQLEQLGFEDVGKDNIVTGETAALIAQEYGFEPTIEAGEDMDLKPRPPPEDPSSLPLRPPVVTIMGHVDHGKTTLLDFLRKSSIVSQEHGGITQHIGAFSVKMSTGKTITFLDTPGHAAFLSMRQRGANVTDIVILVVAADDSVKPQTIEAIKHAQGARVPIIVAINKIDKDSANIDRVKSDLASHGLEIEDYGGEVQVVPVSGKTGQGMGDLEENILLLAEMLDIRSETDGMAEGWVLESSIKPIGRVATVLIKRGTLRRGDYIVAGRVFTKVRSLRNEAGQEVSEAPPGTAVEVLGWKDPPEAGDLILQAPDEDRAKDAVHYRQELKEREDVIAQMAEQEQAAREKELEREREEKREAALERGEEFVEDGDASSSSIKYVNFTVKGDVHGSVEAVTASILEQGDNEVRPRVLISSSGQITESDVEHAIVSGSSIINFNNPIPGHIKRKADDAGVKILDHNVIYHLVEEVRGMLSEQLTPLISWRVVGEAEVLQIFPINVHGRRYKNIAGCRIRNGTVVINSRCRVMRRDKIVFEGTIDELKQGKKDITEIRKGNECGISFENWEEFQEGDQIQTIEEVVEKRTL